MAVLDLKLAKEIQSYGTVDFNACYSCGNCTAICELSEENAFFPRNLIRYGMLGMKDKILSSKEIWLCYGCGECSQTCPREAEPGDYVAALRRYAIAHYEPTGLTRLMFRRPFAFTGIHTGAIVGRSLASALALAGIDALAVNLSCFGICNAGQRRA